MVSFAWNALLSSALPAHCLDISSSRLPSLYPAARLCLPQTLISLRGQGGAVFISVPHMLQVTP